MRVEKYRVALVSAVSYSTAMVVRRPCGPIYYAAFIYSSTRRNGRLRHDDVIDESRDVVLTWWLDDVTASRHDDRWSTSRDRISLPVGKPYAKPRIIISFVSSRRRINPSIE